MTESQELIYDLVYWVFNFGVMILSFVLCYVLAKKYNMSGWFTFAGFFGLAGVVAVVLIAKFSNTNNYDYNQKNNNPYNFNNKDSYGGQNGYNNGYNNMGSYTGQTGNGAGNGYNSVGIYNGQNNDSTGRCGVQNIPNPSGYYGVQNGNASNTSDVYAQNGEVNMRKYKSCPKCGAKLDERASFCTYCGKPL